MTKPTGKRSRTDSEILGSIIAEVIDRRRDGEVPRAAEYIARYPRLREAIEAEFSTVELLEGGFLEAASPPGSPRGTGPAPGDHLGEAISALPEHLQQVILLRNFKNRSWEEIARKIGRPEADLRRQYAHAIRSLLSSSSL